MFKKLFRKVSPPTPDEYQHIQMIAMRAKCKWEELLEASDADFSLDKLLIRQAALKKRETGKVQFTMNAIPKYTDDENLIVAAKRNGLSIGSTQPIKK